MYYKRLLWLEELEVTLISHTHTHTKGLTYMRLGLNETMIVHTGTRLT